MAQTERVRGELRSLAALLAPGLDEVPDEVAFACDDPYGYVHDFGRRLEERGIDEPDDDLPWFALIDALQERDLGAEIDWRAAPEEIWDELRELTSWPADDGLSAWFDGLDTELSASSFLGLAGDRFQSAGHALVFFHIGSDSFPVAFVPAVQAAEAVRLATSAGYPLHVLGHGSRPNLESQARP